MPERFVHWEKEYIPIGWVMTFTSDSARGWRCNSSALLNPKYMKNGHAISVVTDVEALKHDVNFEPHTSFVVGITRWVKWYSDYHDA